MLKHLKEHCVSILMNLSRPRLEYVTLGALYNIPNLLSTAINICATTVPSAELKKQWSQPENKSLEPKHFIEILM